MFILQRYILREHVGPFLFGFFVITLLWILNILFTRLGHLLSRGLPFSVILEFFLLNMAWIVAMAIPMAVLMSTLMTFGRMSADLEITAIKASGINFYRMLSPVFISAVLLCLFLIWFNNVVLPESNHRYAQLARDIQRKRPTISFEPGIIYREIPNTHIRVNTVEEFENFSRVTGVLIFDQSDRNKHKTIIAKRGEIFVDEENGLLRITLYDGEIHETPIGKLEQYSRLKFPKQIITIPIDDMMLERSESEYRSDREQGSKMMLSEIAKNKSLIQRQQDEVNDLIVTHLESYFPFLSAVTDTNREAKSSKSQIAKAQATHYNLRANIRKQIRIAKNITARIINAQQISQNYKNANSRLMVEVHKKYSIPFACIVFVLIGAPLGVMARHGGMAVGGGISLVFFLIYWSFLIGGEELADRQLLSPFLSMWLANILVGSAGIYLVIHTVKELTVIRFDGLTKWIPKKWRRQASNNV